MLVVALIFVGCENISEKSKSMLEPVTSFFTDMFASVNEKVEHSSLGSLASELSAKSESVVNGVIDKLHVGDMMGSEQAEYMEPLDAMSGSGMSGGMNDMPMEEEGIFSSTLSKVGSLGSSITDGISSIAGGVGDIEDSASVVYKNRHLAMGYEDGRIEIENTEGQYASLQVHDARVNNLYIVDNKLISSSDDGSIAVTDLMHLQVIKRMKGHRGGVEGVVAYGDKIFSISRDRTIKIWEISSTGLSRIIHY